MRYALISDIHANLQAWRAVAEDIDRVGVDQVICLGDIVGYGPNPAEVLEEVYLRADHFVLGNHDAVVAGRMDPECFNDTARKIIEWTRQQLNDTARQFLAEVPMMLEGANFVVSHAEFEIPDRFEYIFEPHEALPSFAATRRPYLFCGHTHFPCIISLDPQGETRFYRPRPMQFIQPIRYLVNVGSVGDPRDGDVRSSYVIFDAEKEHIEYRQVPFDTQAYRVAIKRAGIPTQPFLFDVLAEQKQLQAQPLRDFHAVAGAFKPGKAENPVDISNISAVPKTKIYIRRAGSGEKSISAFAISGPKKVDPKRRAAVIGAIAGPLVLLVLWLGYMASTARKQEEQLAASRLAREFIPAQAWTFNEGSGLHARNLTGVSSGDAHVDEGVLWGEGISGSALVFPGDQRAARIRGAKTFLPLDLRKGFSLSFWLKAEAQSSGDIFVARRGDKPAWTLGLRDGQPHLHVFKDGKPSLHVAGKGTVGGEASPEREQITRTKFSPLSLAANDWAVHTRFRAQKDGTIWVFGQPEEIPEFVLFIREGKLVLGIGAVAGLESETPVLDNAWHSVVVTANRQTERIALYVDGKASANIRTPTRTEGSSYFRISDTPQGGPSHIDIAALDIIGEHLSAAAVSEIDWNTISHTTNKCLLSLDFSRMSESFIPNRWGSGFDARLSGAKKATQGDLPFASFQSGSTLLLTAGWDARLHGFPPAQIAPASWRHVVVLHDGSGHADGVQFYVDNKKLSLEIIAQDVPNKPIHYDEWIIGQNSLVAIDDVALFHMPVSSDERRILSHAWNAFTETGPLADGTATRYLEKGFAAVQRLADAAEGQPGKAIPTAQEIERVATRFLGSWVYAASEARKDALIAQENLALEKAWEALEGQATQLAADKSPSEAATWLSSYTGAFAEELKTRRSTLQRKYNADQQSLDKKRLEEQKAAHDAQYTTLANHLVRMEFDEAAALAKAQSGAPFTKAEIDLVNQMLDARKAFFATFTSQNGQRVSVELQGGRVNAFILGVSTDSLAVTIADAQGRNQQLALPIARFSPQEIYRRLVRIDTKGTQMLRAMMVYYGPKKKEAEAEMKNIAPKLAEKIVPALNATLP